MDKLEELKKLIKELSPEEVEEFKTFLNAPIEEPTETDGGEVVEPTETPKEEVETTTDAEEDVPAVETDAEVPSEESTPTEDAPVEETETAPVEEEKSDEAVAEETPTEEEKVEEQEEVATLPQEDDDIPKMQKGIAEPIDESEEAPTAPSITAEDGEELPVDYEQIIEGLNAKLAAVEAENKTLKAKYEGAFGFSSKPSVPTRTNRLYDDAIDVHFHK